MNLYAKVLRATALRRQGDLEASRLIEDKPQGVIGARNGLSPPERPRETPQLLAAQSHLGGIDDDHGIAQANIQPTDLELRLIETGGDGVTQFAVIAHSHRFVPLIAPVGLGPIHKSRGVQFREQNVLLVHVLAQHIGVVRYGTAKTIAAPQQCQASGHGNEVPAQIIAQAAIGP